MAYSLRSMEGFDHGPVPRGGGVFLEQHSMALLVLHALLSVLLLGSTTHNALIVIRYPIGVFRRVALEKLYVRVQLVSYLGTFGLGTLLYPAYRVYTRAAVLDRHAPWAANLFDLKENLAALGLAVVIGYALLSRVIDPREDTLWRPLYVGLGLSLAAIVWFSVVSGLIIVATRAIG